MTNRKDFVVYDMPGMLSTRVLKQDPSDSKNWVADESWGKSVREQMSALFAFYSKYDLVNDPRLLCDIDKVILRFSDFSERGQRFIMSGASDRWLASFDKQGSQKAFNDVRYLEKQLAKIKIA